jgi:phage terminase large subunit-like protein
MAVVAGLKISVAFADALARLSTPDARKDYIATISLLRQGVPLIGHDGKSGLSMGSLCRFIIASDQMHDVNPWTERFDDVLAGEPFFQDEPDDLVIGPLRRTPVVDPEAGPPRDALDSACRIGICPHRHHEGESGNVAQIRPRAVPAVGWVWATPDRLMEALCDRYGFIPDYSRLNSGRLTGLMWALSWSRSRQHTGIVKSMLAQSPQTGKSTSGDSLAVWVLSISNGHCRAITVSHSENLALQRGSFVRQVCEDAPELGIRVAAQDRAKNKWRTVNRFGVVVGGLRSFGMSSKISGAPADVVLVDDAADGIPEAIGLQSEHLWERWTSVLQPRLQSHSMATVLGTRWADTDIPGRLLDAEADEWSRVEIAAISTGDPDDPLGRAEEGHAAEPLRFTTMQLLERKRVLGRLFSALFQQKPIGLSAGYFEETMWGTVALDPSEPLAYCRAWDLAAGGDDWTVGMLMALMPMGQIVIVDIVRRNVGVAAVRRLLVDTAASDAQTWGLHSPVVQVVEAPPGAAGKDQMLTIETLLPDVYWMKPTGSKEARAYAGSSMQLDEQIYLSEMLAKVDVDAFIRETNKFPEGGEHDDTVDAFAYGANYLLFHVALRQGASITPVAALTVGA